MAREPLQKKTISSQVIPETAEPGSIPHALRETAGNPTTPMSSLKLWLDASNINATNNVGFANGDAISEWTDLSGNGNHATQASSNDHPTYSNDGAGEAISFDGQNNFFEIGQSDSLTMDTYSIFVVIEPEETSESWIGVYGKISQDTIRNNQVWIDNSTDNIHHSITDHNNSFQSAVPIEWNNNNLIYVDNNGSAQSTIINGPAPANTQTHNLNYQAAITGNTIVGRSITHYSGSSQDRYHYQGKIKEILHFNGKLDLDKQIQINHYLSQKWNLTTTVDSDGDGLSDAAEAEAGTDPTVPTGNASDNRPNSLSAADLDGDGDLDVLSTSEANIAWYENDGQGTFTEKTISSSVNQPSSVLTADLNGDGDLDVLSASEANIVWYENDGQETFTEKTIPSSDNQPSSISTADLDGDGDLDVLSASGANIVWYENDGQGTFTEKTISSSDNQPSSISAADFDGDGDLDVLFASVANNKISWYEHSATTNENNTIANDGSTVIALTGAVSQLNQYTDTTGRTFIGEITITDDSLGSAIPDSRPTWSQQTLAPGRSLHFDATGSYDPGVADSLSYYWEVASSNGQIIAPSTDPTFNFTPDYPGTYTVTTTLTDKDGGTTTAETDITIYPVPRARWLSGNTVGNLNFYDASFSSPLPPAELARGSFQSVTRNFAWKVTQENSHKIIKATQDTPIQITSPDHGLVNGDQIVITGVDGNTNSQETWTVTLVDEDHFTLNGSTGDETYKTYIGTGTWTKPTVVLAVDAGPNETFSFIPEEPGQFRTTLTVTDTFSRTQPPEATEHLTSVDSHTYEITPSHLEMVVFRAGTDKLAGSSTS